MDLKDSRLAHLGKDLKKEKKKRERKQQEKEKGHEMLGFIYIKKQKTNQKP